VASRDTGTRGLGDRGTKWRYGDAWEKFSIREGEVWGIPEMGSRVAVHNIYDSLPAFMLQADLVFVDPPWNLGNLNTFYTKAGRLDYRPAFAEFADVLFQRIGEIGPRACYIEIGRQGVADFVARLQRLYPVVQQWAVTYYRKHPTWIIRGGAMPADLALAGLDEATCIKIIARCEEYECIGDLCMGQGLVGLAAYAAGKPFVGTELNQRRLAVLLQKLARQGAEVVRWGEVI
jgi:hypothetical protein